MGSISRISRTLQAITIVALVACRESPTSSLPTEGPAPLFSMDGGPEACALLDVQVSGVNTIQVTPTDAGCGALRIVTDGPSYHDRTLGSIRLDLAIENVGDADVDGPVLLALWQDSSVVVEPPGLPNNPESGGFVQLLDADSIAPAGANAWAGALIWLSNLEPVTTPLPLGVRQRFTGLSVDVAIHDGDRRIHFRARARASQQTQVVVPAQAPDSVRPEDLMILDPEWKAPVDLLAVIFHDTATGAEKNAAAGAAGATELVGGKRLLPGYGMDGTYLFRITSDGTMQPLLDAITRLDSMPGVMSAFPMYRLATMGRFPDDGPDWREWRVDPDLQDGDNGALELVAAPLAWGCTVGSPTVPIAVIDQGFRTVNDLAPNVPNPVNSVNPSIFHGTWVASILAARGNNGAGVGGQQSMTGMMWEASLELVDAGAGAHPFVLQTLYELQEAIQTARIVNLSIGADYTNVPLPTGTPADTQRIQVNYAPFRDALASMSRFTTLPLFVVTAGNNGIDAYWSGFPTLAQDFPNNVIVVNASQVAAPVSGSVPVGSLHGTGALIDVAAPGEDVSALDETGTTVKVTGTSFAAPYVTGTAGLLLSFDPTIPNDELKALIVDGAVNGGRTSGGDPLLNAYESLKLAARRPLAPLCGNRVTADAHTVKAERDTGWEDLFVMTGNEGLLNVHHGGSVVDAIVFDGATNQSLRERFELQGVVWSSTGAPPAYPSSLGNVEGSIYNSHKGTSHTADTTAILKQLGDWQVGDFVLEVVATGQPSTTLMPPRPFTEPVIHNTGFECIRRTLVDGEANCLESRVYHDGENIYGGIAWSPFNGRGILWFTRGTLTRSPEVWIDCQQGMECLEQDILMEFTHTDVYEIDFSTGNRRQLFTIPSAVHSIAVSEDGSEIVVERSTYTSTNSIRWRVEEVPNPFPFPLPGPFYSRSQESTFVQTQDTCTVEWFDYETGTPRATAPFTKTCSQLTISNAGIIVSVDPVIGTFAP